jgi:hypothetical protein
LIKVVQHVPGFVSGVEPNVAQVATTADLLALPWIKQYEKRGDPPFFRFSQSDGLLMAEYGDGKKWWVVARLSGDPVDLPEWKSR